MELEAKDPVTPLEEHEARVVELKGFAATLALHLADTQKLLDNTTSTWATMEELEDLVEVCIALQKNQQELDAVADAMKDLALLQCMLKIGENKRLQTELQQLRSCKAEYLKTLQPWQDEVSTITLKVNAKLTEFPAMQTIVANLLDEPPTVELVNIATECVD